MGQDSGRGHGGAFLRELAQMLIDEGSPAVAIDPNAKNESSGARYRVRTCDPYRVTDMIAAKH